MIDVFGRDIKVGDFVMYGSRYGLKVAKIVRMVSDIRKGDRIMLRVLNSTDNESLAKKYLNVYTVTIRNLNLIAVGNNEDMDAKIAEALK